MSVHAPRRRVSLSAVPRQVNLRLYAGDRFAMTITVTTPDGDPVSIDDAQIQAQIRAHPDSPAALTEFEIHADGNRIVLHLSGAQTARLSDLAYWDCEWAERELTLAFGMITIRRQVTR